MILISLSVSTLELLNRHCERSEAIQIASIFGSRRRVAPRDDVFKLQLLDYYFSPDTNGLDPKSHSHC